MLAKIKQCFPYFQRAVASLFAVFLGIAFAFGLMSQLINTFDDAGNFARGAVYGGLTGVILFGLRHAESCWKQAVTIFKYIADNSSASNPRGERINGLSFQITAGISSFFIASPIFLAFFLTPLPSPRDSSTEFVYLWATQRQNSDSSSKTTLLHAPYLIFKPGSLADPDGQSEASTLQDINQSWFSEESFRLSQQQIATLKDYVQEVGQSCQGSRGSVEIRAYGFASDAPFVGPDRRPRMDTDFLNLAIANLRAQNIRTILQDATRTESFDHLKINIEAHEWDNLQQMNQKRDHDFFANLMISFSPYTDHRSVVLELDHPSDCNLLAPDYQRATAAVAEAN